MMPLHSLHWGCLVAMVAPLFMDFSTSAMETGLDMASLATDVSPPLKIHQQRSSLSPPKTCRASSPVSSLPFKKRKSRASLPTVYEARSDDEWRSDSSQPSGDATKVIGYSGNTNPTSENTTSKGTVSWAADALPVLRKSSLDSKGGTKNEPVLLQAGVPGQAHTSGEPVDTETQLAVNPDTDMVDRRFNAIPQVGKFSETVSSNNQNLAANPNKDSSTAEEEKGSDESLENNTLEGETETAMNRSPVGEGGDVEAPPTKKQKRSSNKAYSDEEIERLLEAVGCVQPTCEDDWEAVKVVCEAMAVKGAPQRSVKSLKQKYSAVSLKLVMTALANKPTGVSALEVNPLGAMAKPTRIDATEPEYNEIMEKCSAEEQENDTGGNLEVNPEGNEITEKRMAVKENGVDGDLEIWNEDGTSSNDVDDGSIGEEAEKLSNALISFFEKFDAANGVAIGKGTLDSFVSRLEQMETDVQDMKIALENINTNMNSFLLAVQKP